MEVTEKVSHKIWKELTGFGITSMERGYESGLKQLWEKIKELQMTHDDKPFLSGYLCLSAKQCQDIEKAIEDKKIDELKYTKV